MEFYICSDCTLWAANRDASGADKTWPVNGEYDYIGGFIVGDDEYPFSKSSCDGCGSQLAGYRNIASRH
jgi:hypothetical protein